MRYVLTAAAWFILGSSTATLYHSKTSDVWCGKLAESTFKFEETDNFIVISNVESTHVFDVYPKQAKEALQSKVQVVSCN